MNPLTRLAYCKTSTQAGSENMYSPVVYFVSFAYLSARSRAPFIMLRLTTTLLSQIRLSGQRNFQIA